MAHFVSVQKLCRNLQKSSPSRLLVFTRMLCDSKGYTPRRSFLYIPGNEERKVSKATDLNADCVVLDCEDGVAANRKVISLTCYIVQQVEIMLQVNVLKIILCLLKSTITIPLCKS